MDLRRLRVGEWLMGAAGVAMLVALFLPWYGAGPFDATAWEALSVVDVAAAIAALGAVAAIPITANQRTPAVSIAYEALMLLITGVALFFVLFRVLNLPGGAEDREIGMWLGLLAALALPAACLVAMRDERLSEPGKPTTDGTGVPAPPPEIETLPAP